MYKHKILSVSWLLPQTKFLALHKVNFLNKTKNCTLYLTNQLEFMHKPVHLNIT